MAGAGKPMQGVAERGGRMGGFLGEYFIFLINTYLHNYNLHSSAKVHYKYNFSITLSDTKTTNLPEYMYQSEQHNCFLL